MIDALKRLISDRPFLAGLLAGLLYSILDVWADVSAGDGTWHTQIFAPAALEIRWRLEFTVALVVFTVLISRRMRGEQVMSENSQKLRSIIEGARSAIVQLAPDRSVLEFNPEAGRLYGVSTDEALGKDYFEEYVPVGVRSVAKENFERALAGEPIRGFECPVQTRDGQERVLTWSLSRIVDLSGEPTAVIAMGQDITGRRREERRRQRAKELSDGLNSINAVINSTLDFGRIMDQVVLLATRVMGCDAAVVVLPEFGQWVIKHLYGLPNVRLGTVVTVADDKCIHHAVEQGSTVVCRDVVKGEMVSPEAVDKFGMRSCLAVPLMLREEISGILDFYYTKQAAGFDDEQVDFGQKLGAAVSLALENARLYSTKRDVADTLQQALLGINEEIEDIGFGHLYRSATDMVEVGGDFYDLFEIDANKLGLMVGDVSGKGLEAARLTASIKNTVKAYAHEGSSPAETLRKTNLVSCKTMIPGTFVTVFFGILDRRSGTLTYCGAGHPPPVTRGEIGETSLLAIGSPAIGILEELEFSDHEVVLGAGDMLVAYTDGLTEARKGGDFFGERRLLESIADLQPDPVEDFSERLLERVAAFCGDRFADDIAILCVRLTAGVHLADNV